MGSVPDLIQSDIEGASLTGHSFRTCVWFFSTTNLLRFDSCEVEEYDRPGLLWGMQCISSCPVFFPFVCNVLLGIGTTR